VFGSIAGIAGRLSGHRRSSRSKQVTDLFRHLTKEEYDRLPLEEKLVYLQMLMGDIREKSDETRRAIDARRQREKDPEGS
jgi:hypothetical protein